MTATQKASARLDAADFFAFLRRLRDWRTIAELAAAEGVCTKTIRRRLDWVRSLGFRLDRRDGEFNRASYRVRAPLKTIRGLIEPTP